MKPVPLSSGLIVGSIFFGLELEDVNAKFGVRGSSFAMLRLRRHIFHSFLRLVVVSFHAAPLVTNWSLCTCDGWRRVLTSQLPANHDITHTPRPLRETLIGQPSQLLLPAARRPPPVFHPLGADLLASVLPSACFFAAYLLGPVLPLHGGNGPGV